MPPSAAPTFYLTGRQPLSPGALLLATLLAAAALAAVLLALGHNRRAHLAPGTPDQARGASASSSAPGNDSDDPNQVDTIVLGDPADAPSPARKGDHVSPVHPTIVVRLPRFGPETGLIPDSPTGRLLYTWLAAFNHTDAAALTAVLPSRAPAATLAAELALRHQTGGFSLLSAREPQPGLLVFRLQSQPTPQTPVPTEFLGSLQLRPDTTPAVIASFALRALPSPASPTVAPHP